MANTVGSLIARLGLDAGEFTAGLTKADQQAHRFAADLERSFAAAARGVGLVVTAAVAATGATVAFLKRQADAADALNDLADATGASIDKLSGLEDIARKNGGTLGDVSGILLKFNATLKEADPNSGAAQVLKRLGLDAEELKRIDPAEALRQTAIAFQGFEQDGELARGMMELFGKSAREAGPFLKDVAEQTRLVGTQSAETAAEAERFNKHLFELQTYADDAARALGNYLIPKVNDTIAAFKRGAAEGKGFFATLRDEQLKLLGLKSDPVLPQADYSNEGRNAVRRFSMPPPKPGTSGGGGRSATDVTAEAARYIEALERQQQGLFKLTEAERVLADVAAGRLKGATLAQEQQAIAAAREIDATREAQRVAEERAAFRKADYEAADAAFRANAEAAAAWSKQLEQEARRAAEALGISNDELRDEIAIITGGEEARRAIEQARISSAIATREEYRALRALNEASEVELANLDAEIQKLRERRGLLGQRNNAIDEAVRFEEELEKTERVARDFKGAFKDSFGDFISGAKDAEDSLKSFGNSLARILQDRALDRLADSIFGTSGSNGQQGWIDQLFGTSGTSGTGGGWAALISSFFGGGKAIGGPTMPNKLYQVGERRPEIFNDGSHQYLLTGSRRGRIDPNPALGGGTTIYAPITIPVSGNVDRRTRTQIAAEAARAVRAAARNN